MEITDGSSNEVRNSMLFYVTDVNNMTAVDAINTLRTNILNFALRLVVIHWSPEIIIFPRFCKNSGKYLSCTFVGS